MSESQIPKTAVPPSLEMPDGDGPTVAEQSASFHHPDTAATSSQRLRLVPPDGVPLPWWVRNREKLGLLEMLLTAIFFFLTLYFLWLWIFSPPAAEVSRAPDREAFVAALMALPAMGPLPSWKVAATPGRWRNIVVHHTATAGGTPEAVDKYHRETSKFENGLGYHFIIGNGKGMDDGDVFPSRRWTEQLDGAHVRMRDVKKGNSFAIGIALFGDFEQTIPTPGQLAALRGLLIFLKREYQIGNDAIFGHGQVAERYTQCPGKFFFLEDVIASLPS